MRNLRILIFIGFFLGTHLLRAQEAATPNAVVYGTVTDGNTGEAVPIVSVIFGTVKTVLTDFDGKYEATIPYGTYVVKFCSFDFDTLEKTITVNRSKFLLDMKLETKALDEVEIVADIARDRETPVAFSNITPKKIQEELGSQDLPMVLNSTPGVYATQQGGGDGDARITIRGFNQRNIAALVDGIPVNDMENGWVYWSNWFGLDLITRSIQVQRGLGASKIALPSVGGTMNILTKGIDSRAEYAFKQEVANNAFLRTTIMANSGKLKNGWGFTGAFSWKRGDGWVEETWTKGYFYFAKIEKMLGRHLISATAIGAPQSHAQRSYKMAIMDYDKDYAFAHGVTDTAGALNKGVNYNQHWGYLDRFTINSDGDTISDGKKVLSERVNYYHKPQFYIKDFWTINKKLYIATTVYASLGRGGGTGLNVTPAAAEFLPDGTLDVQRFYNNNKYGMFSIDPNISTTEHKSSRYLRSSVNNHSWYGLLSTLTYKASEAVDVSGGIDLRTYRGEHYRTVYDLLGGDYMVDTEDEHQTTKAKRVGDKISYNNDGLVRWAGAFGQVEYKKSVWSAFFSGSFSMSAYKRIDYFKNKTLNINGTEFTEAVGYGDVFYYNGTDHFTAYTGAVITNNGDTTFIDNAGSKPDGYVLNATAYTNESAEADWAQTGWKKIPGFTFKGGANYNINEFHNVFFNAGFLNKAPRFANVIDNQNNFYTNIENELITAFEIGHSSRYKKFSTNFNAYYTIWKNRPLDSPVTYTYNDEVFSTNINGMNALHMGAELDFAYAITRTLTAEAAFSYGDWTWQSADSVSILDDNGNPVPDENTSDPNDYVNFAFDAKGVHVGDAAQTSFSGMLRWEAIKNSYIKVRYTYFDRQYADFDPFSLQGANKQKDSWKMPGYGITELHLGYTIKFEKFKMDIRGSVFNALNVKYISDARNNDSFATPYQDFDAKSASVFFGQGRRFNISLQVTF